MGSTCQTLLCNNSIVTSISRGNTSSKACSSRATSSHCVVSKFTGFQRKPLTSKYTAKYAAKRTNTTAQGLGFGGKTARKVSPPNDKTQWEVNETCPCGRKRAYDECCGTYHAGKEIAPTAEATMRARFTAYALGKAQYVVDTTHPDNREFSRPTFKEDVMATSQKFRFRDLKVMKAEQGAAENEAFVTFRAYFQLRGQLSQLGMKKRQPIESMIERSRFLREDGRWLFYGPVEIPDPQK